MSDLIVTIAGEIIRNMLLILLGFSLALLIYYTIPGLLRKHKTSLLSDTLLITAASLLGILLPIGIYGLIPLMAALFYTGLRFYIILPIAFSNALFNILIPFKDPTFIWSTGHWRMTFALLISILAGIVLRVLEQKEGSLIRKKVISCLCIKPEKIRDFIRITGRNAVLLGICMAIGVLVDTLFKRYAYWNILSFLNTNPNTSFIPRFMAGYNVTNPVFLAALSIIYSLLDFVKLSALLVLLRIKGIVFYLCYHTAWIVLLSFSAFI